MNIINTMIGSLELFITELLLVVPKLIVAYLIWLIGKWLINLGVKSLDLLQIERWKVDDSVRNLVKKIFVPTAKVILVLVILDTLGIGANVVAALTSALTFTFAIALGLAFGKALEPEAKMVLDRFKSELGERIEKDQQ